MKPWLPLCLLLLAGCDSAPEDVPAALGRVPEYEAAALGGGAVRLADFRDQAVLLNLWATWCPPCRREMPELQQLHVEFHDQGLRVVGVSVDAADADGSVRRFVEELGVEFLILRDPAERALRIFDTHGLPLTLLIDGDGMVRWRHMGPVTADDPELRTALAAIL